jgi:hypothetical protein
VLDIVGPFYFWTAFTDWHIYREGRSTTRRPIRTGHGELTADFTGDGCRTFASEMTGGGPADLL